MKFRPVLSTAFLLGFMTLVPVLTSTKVSAQPSRRPYCTAASNQGGAWMRWGANSVETACFESFRRVLGMSQSVDRATWGYYKTNASNRARLSCRQGNREVLGTGGQVFENARNMRQTLGWNGCIVQIVS